MTERRNHARNAVVRLGDTLVGNRVRNAIDWRIKSAVSSPDGQVAKLLSSKAGRTLVADEIKKQLASTDFSVSVLLGGRVRTNRTLTPEGWQKLAEQLTALTGVANLEWQMAQAYRSLLHAEMTGLGRIAGGPYNILGKLVAPPLLNPPEGPVLEIGTLYGLFSPALLRAFRRSGSFRHLTVVDPFVGLQVQGGENLRPDRSTTPVSKEVAARNFGEFGLAEDGFRIVEGFSTDADAQAEVGDRRYAVIVVDGDHFDEGVYQDLWWVETIALPGAVVVMDDFGDPKWPGVESATRRYLADGGKLELLGTASTSGYLRMPLT